VRVFFFQCRHDSLKHTIPVRQNVMVPKADDSITFAFEPSSPSKVASLVMLSAVDFDDQSIFQATEINNIGAKRPLPFELATF